MYILIGYLMFVVIIFFATFFECDDIISTPKDIYEASEMNMFGCVLVYIMMLIFDPLLYVVKFLRWISHVGR